MLRLSSTRLLFNVSLLVAGMVVFQTSQFAVAQTSAARQNQQSDTPRDSRSPFHVYAEWALDKYDENLDGVLSRSEMKPMLSPLVEDRYDLNEDGGLSFDEIVAAIRKPSAADVDQERPEPAKSRVNSKIVKYAQALINQYDRDDDQMLSLEESKKMRRPIEPSVDSNGDHKFSLHEIAQSLTNVINPTARNAKQPMLVIDRSFKLEIDKLAERFLQASLAANDANGDGQLKGDEIANANWSGTRWQDSDTNNDSALSRDELLARYRTMFAGFQRSAANTTSPRRRSANRSGPGRSRNSLRDPDNNRAVTSKKSAQPSVVNIQLFLLRLPANSNSERLTDSIRSLRSSGGSTANAVQNLSQELGLDDYDQLKVSVVDQQSTKLRSGASVPMIVSTNRSDRGRSVNKQFVDVGLNVQLTPEIIGDEVRVTLDLEKSDLIVNAHEKDEETEEMVVNWNFDSSVLISPDKPAILGSSNSRQQWILVIDAVVAN